MKKQLLIGAFFLSSLMAVNAQTTVWSDNFDDEDISDWTLVDSDGDGANWSAVQIQDENSQPVGTPLLRSASWANNVALTPDNWAISPAVDLSAFSSGDPISLNWSVMAVDADFDAENYSVYVGTTNSVDDLLLSEVTFDETTLDGVNTLTPRTLDISSFAGQTVYVAFRHYNVSDEFTMEIDDVSVTSTVASVNDYLSSQFSVFPNPATNVVTITNSAGSSLNSAAITDINGRTVKSVALNGAADAQINIADLSTGMYIMTISSDKGTATKKIVKN